LPDPTPPRQWTPRTPDEWISLARLGFAGLLWIPAALRKPRLVAAGIVISAVSDIADGLVCRYRGERSSYSSQLDAIADCAVMLSSLGWLALARPGGLDPLRRTLCVISLVSSTLLLIEWRRYRMIGALHIDSARAAAVVGHLYVLNMLWRDAASKPLRRLFQLLVTGGMIESAWVILGPHDPMDGSPRPLLQWLKRTARA
jgi:phosphatidylglycerophosphate synthase